MYTGGKIASWIAIAAMLAGAVGIVPCARANSPVPQVECKAISVPRNTRASIIAPRIVINSMPMTIVSATNPESPDKFAAYYKKLWKGSGPHPLYVVNQVGQWNVIAHMDGKCMYTVQIKRGTSSAAALLGVGTPGNKVSVHQALDFPAPGDARPLTHMVSQDGGTVGDTWLLYTGNSVHATARYYQTVMPQIGWKMLLDHADALGTTKVLMFRNGNRNAGITVQPLGHGAAITLTVMQR
jgi:hypothetical protein